MVWHKQALSRFRSWRHRRQFRTCSVCYGAGGSRLIRERILSGKPLMVSRFSNSEICVLNVYLQRCRNVVSRKWSRILTGVPLDYTEKILSMAHNNAGIFPETAEGLDRFSQITLDACREVDVLAIWDQEQKLRLEERLYRERCPSADLVGLQSLLSYCHAEPWSAALAGKKVLVIHPFEASIRKQYAKRERLFSSPDVLPAFELQTLKAVQSSAGAAVEFPHWAAAFESMTGRMDQMDFDIALIGAGAYGLPLAAYAKRLGKQAVHMGGALQLLFGIKGARWDSLPEISRLYNDSWIRPLLEETPARSGLVEEGCYW